MFVIHSVEPPKWNPQMCFKCKKIIPEVMFAMAPSGIGQPLSWLRRIPPLGELEEHKEEIKETV